MSSKRRSLLKLTTIDSSSIHTFSKLPASNLLGVTTLPLTQRQQAGWFCSVLGRLAHEAVTGPHPVQTTVEKYDTPIT